MFEHPRLDWHPQQLGVANADDLHSDSGDDKNDGLSLQTAIYSLKWAKEVRGGRNDFSWHFGPRAWKRIRKELADKKKKE